VPFLGEVPLDTSLREAGDAGNPIVAADPESVVAKAFGEIAERVAAQVSIADLNTPKIIIE